MLTQLNLIQVVSSMCMPCITVKPKLSLNEWDPSTVYRYLLQIVGILGHRSITNLPIKQQTTYVQIFLYSPQQSNVSETLSNGQESVIVID